MAEISYAGAFNAATLQVADLYLNVQIADTGSITAANSGYVGLIGVASWGPLNKASAIGGSYDINGFGFPVVRTADLVTHANVIMQTQQAAGIGYKLYCVRVSDGTDLAANAPLGGLILVSYYTGSLGNTAQATLAVGSQSTTANPTWTLTLQMAGRYEVFANVPGTGPALWAALASAINNGQSLQQGASALVTSAVIAPNTAATATQVTLAGGTDGDSGLTSSQFVGVDGATESGIFAFRGLGLSLLAIADFFDDQHMSDLAAFGISEGVYVHTAGPAGETPLQAQLAKNTFGIASAWLKRLVGDWCFINDNYNGIQRLISPSTVSVATLSVLQPNGSGLNKQAIGVVATQKSKTGNQYGRNDLATITNSGLDTVCKPIPAGSIFGLRTGLNTSNNNSINGDNYSLMTSFLARSISGAAAVGGLIGQPITDDFFIQGYDIFDAFFGSLTGNGRQNPPLIDGYSISFNAKNSTQAQLNQGIVIANLQVKYQSIARIFLVNLQSGQTVVLQPSVAPALAAAA